MIRLSSGSEWLSTRMISVSFRSFSSSEFMQRTVTLALLYWTNKIEIFTADPPREELGLELMWLGFEISERLQAVANARTGCECFCARSFPDRLCKEYDKQSRLFKLTSTVVSPIYIFRGRSVN